MSKYSEYSSSPSCWYLNGSVQVGFLPAVVQQACDGDAIRQVVDEGDVVDQVVSLPDAEYHNCGSTLKNKAKREDFSAAPPGTDQHLSKCPFKRVTVQQ